MHSHSERFIPSSLSFIVTLAMTGNAKIFNQTLTERSPCIKKAFKMPMLSKTFREKSPKKVLCMKNLAD